MAAVDSRLLQANERTLLAWIRTGIALMTFGFVIARIGVWLRALPGTSEKLAESSGSVAWIGATFAGMGVLGNALAIHSYIRSKRALLAGEELPNDAFPVLFASVVTILGGALGTYLLFQLK